MSTHNIGFYENLTKIIFQLSSNTHLISSSDTYKNLLLTEPINSCIVSVQQQISLVSFTVDSEMFTRI